MIIASVSIHLRPTAAVAADALLPGDPKWAMELATGLTERPLMSNLSRGLWGYHGTTADGRELTVQSTGIGAPSAAVVLHELSGLGVRRAVRLGTCTALAPELEAGTQLVVSAALSADGFGSELAAGAEAAPDGSLMKALAQASGARSSRVVSTDIYYEPESSDRRALWSAAGAAAVDLCTAPLFALAERLGVELACGLVVSRDARGEAAADERLASASLELGAAAARALADRASP